MSINIFTYLLKDRYMYTVTAKNSHSINGDRKQQNDVDWVAATW